MTDRVRVPWLHDRHSHTSFYAALIGCPSLAGLDRAQALASMEALPGDRVSMVFGWHSAKLPLVPEDLAALPPAIIVNLSMHGFALTAAAVETLRDTQPEVVARRGDPDWCERNLPMLLQVFNRTARLTPEKLDAFMARMEAAGLGAVDDMLLPGEEELKVLRGSRWGGQVRCWCTPEAFRSLSPEARQAVEGFKFFTDGALGSRTAGLRGEFLDGRRGLLLYSDEELERALAEVHPFAKGVAIHAIGDLAIEQVLKVLGRLRRNGLWFPLVRLEHVQFIDELQARRAREMGIVLSMQPNFNSDSVDYADRLAPRWLEINNPFRMLIDRVGFVPGRDLVFGSDGMPHGVEYALQWSLFPAFPGQRLTLDELVAGYGTAGTGHSMVEIDEAARTVRLLESKAGN